MPNMCLRCVFERRSLSEHLLELRNSTAGSVAAGRSKSLAGVKIKHKCFIACHNFPPSYYSTWDEWSLGTSSSSN